MGKEKSKRREGEREEKRARAPRTILKEGSSIENVLITFPVGKYVDNFLD